MALKSCNSPQRGRQRPADEPTDADLFALLQTSDQPSVRAATMEHLVRRHGWIVAWAAGRYRERGEPVEVLRQVGYVGLVEAIGRFDPDRGVDFASFAIPTVLGEIRRHFRDCCQRIRVPRRLHDLQVRAREAERVLTRRTGRPPTVRAIAEHLGVDEEDVIEMQVAYTWYHPTSLDAPLSTRLDGSATWADLLGGDDPRLDRLIDLEALAHLVAELPERERCLLGLCFYEDKSQAEIAQCLGISQMHVSRLLARTLGQLRAALNRVDDEQRRRPTLQRQREPRADLTLNRAG